MFWSFGVKKKEWIFGKIDQMSIRVEPRKFFRPYHYFKIVIEDDFCFLS